MQTESWLTCMLAHRRPRGQPGGALIGVLLACSHPLLPFGALEHDLQMHPKCHCSHRWLCSHCSSCRYCPSCPRCSSCLSFPGCHHCSKCRFCSHFVPAFQEVAAAQETSMHSQICPFVAALCHLAALQYPAARHTLSATESLVNSSTQNSMRLAHSWVWTSMEMGGVVMPWSKVDLAD